jgi:hypothetical protein
MTKGEVIAGMIRDADASFKRNGPGALLGLFLMRCVEGIKSGKIKI